MHRRHTLLLLSFLALSACEQPFDSLSPTTASEARGGTPKPFLTLTILHNNDGESELLPDDSGNGGVARFATVVDNLRSQISRRGGDKEAVLLVSSGDNFLAGAAFNASLDAGVPYYDGLAMDYIGYDAIAIGNHEFDFGPDVLAGFISSFPTSRPPFLSANLDVSGEPELAALASAGRIAKSTIVKLERGVRIGVIGATTPQLPFISSPRNVVVSSMVAVAVMDEVRKLQQRGIKFIVLISHLQSVNEDLALIPLLDDIDVVVAGGGDELLANSGDELLPGDAGRVSGAYPLQAFDSDGTYVPVVTTSGQYRYVGRLVVDFDPRGDLIRVSDISGPVAVKSAFAPDPVIEQEVIAPLREAIDALGNNIIVGTSNVVLDGTRANVRTRETNQGNLIADAHLWQVTQLALGNSLPTPHIALQNGGGIRNDDEVPAGPLTRATLEGMLPFSNFLAIVPNVPRSQFKEILENAVSLVESVNGRFAQISGFRFEYTLAGTPQTLDADENVVTAGTRVRNVWLNDGTQIVAGGAVVPGPALNIATIDFLANGGDQYPFRGTAFTSFGVTYAQALESYVVSDLNGTVSAVDYPAGGEGRITQLP